MNQSTIYRRHEARLTRSYALRDDPRPAFLRVLSGLPGFRMIVPPYQPGISKEERRGLSRGTEVVIGDYSEDSISDKNGEARDRMNSNHWSIDSRSSGQTVWHAIVATGACAGGAEYAYNLYRGGASRAPSPFVPKTMYYPFLRRDTDALGVYLLRSSQQKAPTAVNPAPTPPIRCIALTAALTTSAMFGTKVATQRYFSVNDNNGRMKNSMSANVLSSVVAGGVVGMGQLVALHQRPPTSLYQRNHQQFLVEFSAQRSMLGRHVLAACLYFSIYDGISTLLHQGNEVSMCETMNGSTNDSHKTTIGILAGGAMAGCAHAAALNYHYGIWRVIPAVARAAPFHALVFSGFESMRNGLQTP
jgi:hypothetical protein